MMTPRPRRPIVLLLLATLIADVVVVHLYHREPLAPEWIEVSLYALFLSQTSLAGLWMGLGRSPGPLRTLGMLTVIAVWGWVEAGGAGNPLGFILVLLSQCATIAACLLIARWRDLTCRHLSEQNQPDVPKPATWQFSIAALLAWTTILAIVLATCKLAGILNPETFDWRSYVELFLYVWPGRVLVALAALWMTLGKGSPLGRFPVFLLVVAAATGESWLLERWQQGNAYVTLAEYAILEAALLLGSLLVIRRAGYRVELPLHRDAENTPTIQTCDNH